MIFELYLDDQLIMRDSTLYGQFSSGWPDASYNTPYFDGFHFALPPDPVFYEEGTMGEVTGFNQCGSTTSWTPSTDIVTLTIVSGSDYVQFWNVVDYPRAPMGSTISVLASQLQNYMLAADGTLPDSQGVWVSVKAESNGIEETDSVLVVPYFLQFVFNPDSVQSGGKSRIVIKTVDAQGDDHVRLIEPLVSVGIQDSTEYGTLSYNESGEVLADTIDGIQTLLIADEFSGVELKFLANEKVPTQTFPVTLFAKKTDEGLSFFPIPPSLYPFPGRDTVKGGGLLVLKPGKSITLSAPMPKTLWPTLPAGRSGGNPGNRNRKDSITVRVAIAGEPVIGESLLVKANFVLRSGGHDHENLPPDSLMGIWSDLVSGTTGVDSLIGATDDSGRILVRYTAPRFSGKIEFVARSLIDTSLVAKDTVVVKVDSLFALPADTSYELVGAPNNHAGTNDPCRMTPPASDHSANHFGTLLLLQAIDSIAVNYHRMDPDIRLRVNDLSLEWGGLFDIPNNWKDNPTATHNEHRIGKSADIGFSGISAQSSCKDIRRPLLLGFVNRFTTDAPYPHSDHYHIRMR